MNGLPDMWMSSLDLDYSGGFQLTLDVAHYIWGMGVPLCHRYSKLSLARARVNVYVDKTTLHDI